MTTKPKQHSEAETEQAETEQAPPTVPAGTIDSEGTFRPS